MTRIASSPSLAVRAPRSASRRILRGRRCSYERGCAEDGAAAAVVRRGARALTGAAGALLAVWLLAAAANLAAGLGVVRADAAAGELRGHDLVEHGLVHRRAEEIVMQLDAADAGPRAVVKGGRWHRSGLPDQDQAAPGTGQAALDEEQVLLGVGTDDLDLLRRRLLVAHVARHAHALVHATGGRARADRARLAMVVGAMGLGAAAK